MSSASFLITLCFLLGAASLHARPVDLSIPPGGHGPIDSRGYAQHWIGLAKVDFGTDLILPLRLSFLSSRTGPHGFGDGLWQAPLLESRFLNRSATQWQVLLPCGKVMTLVPRRNDQKSFATHDEEWTGVVKGPRTLISREDGWEMEFDQRGLLLRLRTDTGRTVLWSRLADGSLRTLNEVNGGKIVANGLTLTWDAGANRITAMEVRTSDGVQSWRLDYEAGSGRLRAVTSPDREVERFTYFTDAEDNPGVTFRSDGLKKDTLIWHRTLHTLVSDGLWTYSFKQAKGDIYPVTTRVDARGEKEVYHDDVKNGRTLFTGVDSTLTIRKRVTDPGPAHDKLLSITRQTAGAKHTLTVYQARYDLQSGELLEETVSLPGHQYSRKVGDESVIEALSFLPSNLEAVRTSDKAGNASALDLNEHSKSKP